MNPTRYVAILLLLLAALPLNAQQYVVAGRVVSPSNAPLSRAGVQLENLRVNTNAEGFFYLRTDLLPNVLTVKYQGFPTKEQLVNMPQIGSDTVFITIRLDHKETSLEEVTVTASKIIWAYPKANVHVIDFDLYKDGMLLLCKDNNRYLLRLVDALSEPIVDLPVTRHPKSFFRDCMGNIHVVYADSAFQVNIGERTLSLKPGISSKELERTYEPCALSVRNRQIYKYEGPYHQSADFVMIDTLSHQVNRLYRAKSRKYLRMIDEYQREIERENRALMKDITANNNSVDTQLKLQDIAEKRTMYQKLMAAPVYAPVFLLRDSIVIFDHANDSAVVFNKKGHPIRRFPIIYQHHKKWDNELIIDETGKRIFARYNYGGMVHLVQINPDNGDVIREVPLEKHIYPGKIQVRDNFIYYIYHHNIDYCINYVYKQKIPETQELVEK